MYNDNYYKLLDIEEEALEKKIRKKKKNLNKNIDITPNVDNVQDYVYTLNNVLNENVLTLLYDNLNRIKNIDIINIDKARVIFLDIFYNIELFFIKYSFLLPIIGDKFIQLKNIFIDYALLPIAVGTYNLVVMSGDLILTAVEKTYQTLYENRDYIKSTAIMISSHIILLIGYLLYFLYELIKKLSLELFSYAKYYSVKTNIIMLNNGLKLCLENNCSDIPLTIFKILLNIDNITRVDEIPTSLCKNYSEWYDVYSPVNELQFKDYFVLIIEIEDGVYHKYCIPRDGTLEYINNTDNILANWIENPNSSTSKIETMGEGGMPGNQRFYPIPVDFNTNTRQYIDEKTINIINQPQINWGITVYTIYNPQTVRLGNLKGHFGFSMTHGQTLQTVWTFKSKDIIWGI